MRSARSVNPATGAIIAEHPLSTDGEIAAALDRVQSAQREWRAESSATRSDALRAIGRELAAAREELAELITAEMGKTLSEARAEIDKSVWVCDYYADNGSDHLAGDVVETDFAESFVQYDPLGVVLAVMPWNYPVWQVMRAAAPALMAGNAGNRNLPHEDFRHGPSEIDGFGRRVRVHPHDVIAGDRLVELLSTVGKGHATLLHPR